MSLALQQACLTSPGTGKVCIEHEGWGSFQVQEISGSEGLIERVRTLLGSQSASRDCDGQAMRVSV